MVKLALALGVKPAPGMMPGAAGRRVINPVAERDAFQAKEGNPFAAAFADVPASHVKSEMERSMKMQQRRDSAPKMPAMNPKDAKLFAQMRWRLATGETLPALRQHEKGESFASRLRGHVIMRRAAILDNEHIKALGLPITHAEFHASIVAEEEHNARKAAGLIPVKVNVPAGVKLSDFIAPFVGMHPSKMNTEINKSIDLQKFYDDKKASR